MAGKIIQLLFSVGLIVGGVSGTFVLRGTDSSAALVAVGVLWLIFDICQFIPFIKAVKVEHPKKQRKGRSPLFFMLCGLYIAANLFCAVLLLDELSVTGGAVMEVLALCGNAMSIAGVVLLLRKKHIGLFLALAGSAVSVAFTILSGIFIVGSIPHFDTGGFIGFMLITLMPGFLLWFQVKYAKQSLSEKNHLQE